MNIDDKSKSGKETGYLHEKFSQKRKTEKSS